MRAWLPQRRSPGTGRRQTTIRRARSSSPLLLSMAWGTCSGPFEKSGRPGRSGVVVVGAGTNNACGVRTLGPWPRPRAHSTTAAHGGNNALASSGRRARVVFVSKSASLPRHFTTHRRGDWPGRSPACPAALPRTATPHARARDNLQDPRSRTDPSSSLPFDICAGSVRSERE